MTDLRTLLAEATHSDPQPWREASVCAGYALGREIADLIVWQPEWDEESRLLGEIPTPGESEASLVLRYRCDEGSGSVLEVAVPCDARRGCGPAWQVVDNRGDLQEALDGRDRDPMCPACGAP